MPTRKASIEFDFFDNGQAVATLNLIDAAGLPAALPAGASLSVPPWASDNPGVVVSPAADGMSAILTPSTPPVLVTGVNITAGPATLTNADGSTVTITAAVGVVGVKSGGPSGFQMTEA